MASYQVELTTEAGKEIRNAPGHLRARILAVLHTLEHNYSPRGSRQLDLTKLAVSAEPQISLWRVRLDSSNPVHPANPVILFLFDPTCSGPPLTESNIYSIMSCISIHVNRLQPNHD